MSMKSEALRIEDARNTIRDKLVELGLATETDNITVLAEAIQNMSGAGGGGATYPFEYVTNDIANTINYTVLEISELEAVISVTTDTVGV